MKLHTSSGRINSVQAIHFRIIANGDICLTEGGMGFLDFFASVIAGKPSSEANIRADHKNGWMVPAIEAHLLWKKKLLDALDKPSAELPNPAAVGLDDHCDLGRWLYAQGEAQFGNQASFAALRMEHARFHRVAQQVIELAQAGKRNEAQRLLDGEFKEASLEIIAGINALAKPFREDA
jgi:hypothetical protein